MRKFSSAAAAVAACAVAVLFALAACKAPDGAGRSASAGAKFSSTPGAKPSASKPQPSATPSDGVRRVTPQETKELVDKGEAVVVDVREASQFKGGRIKGSINVPRTEIMNRLGDLPKDKLLIFYCA